MRAFITGANGFIGRNLIEQLQRDGYFCDFYQRTDVIYELNKFNPDIIFNCAAEIYQPDKMFDSNIKLVNNILEWVKNNSNTRMIQLGSSSEYGPMPVASSENDRINPIDLYQATKGAATLLCQGYARQYHLDITIVRPYSVYGQHEKPHRLFPMLWKAAVLNQPMTLHAGEHDFIYIKDFIKGLLCIVNNTTDRIGDIINLGSGLQYSNLEVLKIFEEVADTILPVTYIDQLAKSFESNVWKCNTSYCQNTYGFKCEYDLKSGIIDFLHTADYR